MKPKKKKTPVQVARGCARQRAYWKRDKFARQLRAGNLAVYNARLKKARTIVSPQVSVPVFSHPENSGCLDLSVPPIVSESNRHLTIESGNITQPRFIRTYMNCMPRRHNLKSQVGCIAMDWYSESAYLISLMNHTLILTH